MDSPATTRQGQPAIPEGPLAEESRQIAKGGATVVASTIFAHAVHMVATFWIARRLGPDEYGLLTLSTSFLLPLAALANLGMHRTLLRFVPVHIGNKDDAKIAGAISSAFVMVGVASVVVALATIALSAPIANIVFSEPRLEPVLRALAITVPLIVITTTALTATRSLKIMLYDAIVLGAGPVFRLLAWGAGLLLLKNLLSAAIYSTIFQWLLSAILAVGFFLWLFRKHFGSGIEWSYRSLWAYSSPLILSTLMVTLASRMDRLVLGIVAESFAVGVYGLAAGLVLVVNLVHASMVKTFLPVIADAYNRVSPSQAKMLYLNVARWDTRLTFVALVTSILLAQEVLGLLGDSYSEAILPFIILGAAVYISTIPGPAGAFLQMTNRQRVDATNAVVFLVAGLVIQLGLALWLGWIGVAIGALIVAILLASVQVAEIYHYYHFHPFEQSHILFSALSIVIVFICALAGLHQGFVVRLAMLGLTTVAFLGFLYLYRTPEDTMLFQMVLARTPFGTNERQRRTNEENVDKTG